MHKNVNFCLHFSLFRIFSVFLRLICRNRKMEVFMKKEKARPCYDGNIFVFLKEVAIWKAF